MYIFLDESGDIKGNRSECFVVCGFKIGDKKRIEKEFIKWQRKKFPKKLKYQSEVKFTDHLIDENLRLKTIEHIIKLDPVIFYTYLSKKNIPKEYRKKGKVTETGHLYTQIVGDTIELLLPSSEKEFRIFIDKRNLKGIRSQEFKEILKARIIIKLSSGALLQIELLDSTTSKGIQIVDWLCGAISRYIEDKKNGKKFYLILKNNIIKKEELFKDYWTNLHNNKK